MKNSDKFTNSIHINDKSIENISAYISEIEKAPEKHTILHDSQKKNGTITLPWYEFSGILSKLIKELYKSGCILKRFNWPEWQNEAAEYLKNNSKLKDADLLTTCKLITTHIRKDRFCEGHLSVMLERGHFIAVLKHLIKLTSDEKEKNRNE